MLTLELESPCKINLVLDILCKRADGYHELETVFYPVRLADGLRLERNSGGIVLTCDHPQLPTDASNLAFKAAAAFFKEAQIPPAVSIHLSKRVPLAAGLGGGSSNAAVVLLGLNQLFQQPLSNAQLQTLAAGLGSDVPFFLQSHPALATGRGEHIQPLPPISSLAQCGLLLIHPGFGISTAWAYQTLARFPAAYSGKPGRARKLIEFLKTGDNSDLQSHLFNSLEAPALYKYPILSVYQDFLREQEAIGTLMSGSGSTTFAFFASVAKAQSAQSKFQERFSGCWTQVVPAS